MTTTKTTTIAISSASTFSSTTPAEAAPVSRGCGPVNSTDLALGLANDRRERLSEAEKREQMRIALSIETGTGESGRGDRIVSRGLGERWPNGVVPYILSCSYDEKDRGIIATAIDNIEKNSCVRFRGATVEDKDYVTINNTETGCFVRERGYLGPSNGEHVLNLQRLINRRTCMTKGTVVHELMHSLGFAHEQVRPDRDEYLTVDWVNIKLSSASQHWKQSWTVEDLRAAKRCTTTGFTQSTASFDDCVRGFVVVDYGIEYDFTSIMHYGLTDSRVDGYDGNVLNPKNTSINETGGTELSSSDKLRLQRAYGCDGSCGGHQYSSTGGSVTGEATNKSPLCEWVVETDVGKGISINMESFNFDGDCSTNYVEVRVGRTHEGALIEKYCTGSVTSGPKKVKSTALWIGWKRTSDNTIFSLAWTTFTVSCCSKLFFENHLSRNGFYEKNGTSISTGPLYKYADDDQILYYGRIVVDSINNLGWKVGPSLGLVGIYNLDPVTCPEDALSPWRSYTGSEFVYIADASVRCSNCSLYPTFGECLTCCNEVILSSTDAGFLADAFYIRFAGKYILYTTTPTLNGRKVYQLESNTLYCLYFTSQSRWNINTCAELGELGFFITTTTTTENNCVHSGLPWQWSSNQDTTMKVECIGTCTSDPPATPSTATSTWDSSTKTVGTVVTYTCPDTTVTRTVCDGETLAWIPATIPDC